MKIIGIIGLGLLALMVNPSQARDMHPFDAQHFADGNAQKEYFKSLTSRRGHGGGCCSSADGLRLEDPDWTQGTEIKGQKCILTSDDQQNTKGIGRYCAKIEGVWYLVPDEAIIDQIDKPDPIGIAEVWPIFIDEYEPYGGKHIKHTLTQIRCFKPGQLG